MPSKVSQTARAPRRRIAKKKKNTAAKKRAPSATQPSARKASAGKHAGKRTRALAAKALRTPAVATWDVAAAADRVALTLKGQRPGKAGTAVLIDEIEDAVEIPGASAAELAAGRLRLADYLATNHPSKTMRATAAEAADGLRDAKAIVEREDAFFARARANKPAGYEVSRATAAREFVGLADKVAAGGAAIAHDSWYASSLGDTIKGKKANDLKGFGRTGLRARPFMAPSSSILDSGDGALITTMRNNNEGGIRNTLQGLLDAMGADPKTPGGRRRRGGIDGTTGYLKRVEALPDHFADVDRPKVRLSAGTKDYLATVAAQLAEARDAYQRREAPNFKKLRDAYAALKATHDRYVKNTTWAADDQKVPFAQLSPAEQARDVPVLMATLDALLGKRSAQRAK